MVETLRNIHPLLPPLAGLAVLALVALAADLVVRRLLLRAVRALVRRTRLAWDDALTRNDVLGRLAQIVPALIVLSGVHLVPDLDEGAARVIRNVASAYVVLMLTLALSALLGAANRIYETYPISRARPLKGFVQVLQLVVFVLGGVMVVATLMERSPLLLLSGLGAMTAILMLVFKDTLLGLVASVQLTAHDMVRVGDWIEMPQVGADGDVLEVSLHTVKVQNWDKTITTIPTYKMISESFKNWRGMSEWGGRRIKRAIYLDQASIRFLDERETEHFKRFALLRDYVTAKTEELERHYASLGEAGREPVNRRRLTNVGTFRAYVFHYLKAHPRINDRMTLLVRQLPPGPEGLPIEIYCFTSTVVWAEYENIQSDVFDHILAIVPEFGLRLFQRPAGADVAAAVAGLQPAGHGPAPLRSSAGR
ncbi:MAG TPA: mechanosensitive ion channel domain-containing protein [Gammaproteobacteria bacterium]